MAVCNGGVAAMLQQAAIERSLQHRLAITWCQLFLRFVMYQKGSRGY